MEISRREFLKLGLAGGVALALPFGTSACSGEGSTGTLLPSRAELPEPFGVPLPIPPVLEPVRTDAGIDYYEMTQRVGMAEILPGKKTEIWGYEGIFPGPTIESRSGRKVVVRQRNDLPVPVSTHLHGGRTPPDSDGYPTDLIMPKRMHHRSMAGSMDMGGSRHHKDYTYPLAQRAATLWYHDHRMDFTGPQVWRGLAGFHIVRDEEEDVLPLPKGERDIPLMICDRSFDEDGGFLYPSLDPSLQDKPGVEDGEFRFTRVGDEGRAMWGINGEPFDPGRMSALPKLGSTEIWHLRAAPASHPIHLHLVHFKVLSRNNGKPLPTDAGWKDTVDLTSGEEVRVLVRFGGYRGKYVFHCHNLEHEDMMMMANFEVV